MKKTTLLSLALACGLSLFGAQRQQPTTQSLKTIGQGAKVMMTKTHLDAIQLPGVKAQAPAKAPAAVADYAGTYEWTYTTLINGGGSSAELTFTIDDEATGEATISGFAQGFTVKATINTAAGTISIANNQYLGTDNGGDECYFYVKGVDSDYNILAGAADVEATVGTVTDGVVSFPRFDIWAIGDPNAEDLGWWTLTYANVLTQQITEDPNADPNEGWTSLGEASFVDGWVLSGFGMDQRECAYLVELQQNDENPNMYRLVDPYKGNCPIADYNESTKTGYIQFDATDPDHVVFSIVENGFAASMVGITKMYSYDALTFLMNEYSLTAEQVIEAVGDQIPYTTFKNKVLTVPTGAARFGIAGDINGGYSWEDNEGNATDMFASITWPADEPSGVAPKPAVSELVDGGYYYVYDAHDERYGFFQDPSTGSTLARIWGDHVSAANAYGQFTEAKYIWQATKTEEGYWHFQNVGTENYFGTSNNASATPDNCSLELISGSTNTFYVKSEGGGKYWNADYPINNGIALSMWYGGHPIQFYQAVSDNDSWNLDADASYTITCNFIYNGETISTQSFSGVPGSEYSFTAPHFYSCEPVSGVITQYNLTFNVECELNLPLKISASVEDATYQALNIHSNIQRMLAYNEEADAVYGYVVSDNTTPFTDNQLFALIGSFEEGVKVYSKTAGKALQMNGTGTSATTSLVELEEATVFQIGASDVAGEQYFALYKAGEPYLNIQNKNNNWTLLYWYDADAGSTMWAYGIAQPEINGYNNLLTQAKALNLESISELIAQAEELVNGIDPWTEVPEDTAAQLDEIAARISNVVTANQLRPYFEASYSGADMADYFVNMAAGADVEEFQALYDEALNQAVLYMQSDMESGFVMKNKRNNRYMGYVATEDPDDEEVLITSYRSGDMGLNAYWTAEFTDNGDEVPNALDRTFYLKNVLSNTYVGTSVNQSTALPCVAADYKAEEAALLKVVAGNNGFEFIIVNSGIDNNYINTDASANGALVTWNYANDPGAFWIAAQLPAFNEETQPVRVNFVGEAAGEDEYTSINAVEIKVPAGAALTEIGNINVRVSVDDTDTTMLNGNLATLLAGAEPTEGTIEETIYNSNGEEVTVSTAVDVYQIVLKNVATEAGIYYVTVSTAAFQLESEEAGTIYSPEFYNYGVITKAAEPFTITVAPEAGTVEEIVNITLNSETGMAVNGSYTGEATITLKKDVDTVVLDLKGDDMMQYDSFSFDDMTAPYYTIPVNITEAGTYALVIPEGFFENDEMAPNAEVTVTWTIEEKEGINSITNVTVNGQTIFDLQGRRVNKAGKGIYIINGEKTLVK